MKTFIVIDSSTKVEVQAGGVGDAARSAVALTSGRVLAVWQKDKPAKTQFYFVRGSTPYPVSARVAGMEFAMGGSR